MIKTIIEAFKMKDVRSKILWTLFLLLVYRIGCWIPIPGISPEAFASKWRGSGAGDFLEILNAVAGGALANGAILALGVGPYITSSIVVQLLTIALPPLERLSKQGNEGRRKLAVITRYVALFLSIANAIAITVSFNMSGDLQSDLFGSYLGDAAKYVIPAVVVMVLVAGSMFTVWIGDKITEYGVSNGMSMLIFVGILATGALAFVDSIFAIFDDVNAIWTPIIFLVTLSLIFFFITYVDLGERQIPVQYSKQVRGNKMYGGQSTHIPLKVNAVGVIPIVFAFSLINFPQLIMSYWPQSDVYQWWAKYMGTGEWPNIVITALLILAFSYFYATITFDPEDVARNLHQSGAYINGYRPGPPTRDYLKKVHNRMTLFGAVFLATIALVPSLIFGVVMNSQSALTNAFSSIGMLICVSVALELDRQLQGLMLVKTHKGFLK